MEIPYKKQLLCAAFLTLGMTIVPARPEQTQVNNIFSLNFFEKVLNMKGDSSVIASPLGVSFMLGMLDNGAVGETAQEINQVMGVTDAGMLASYQQNLMMTFLTLDERAEFNVANSIVLNNSLGCSFLPAYVDKMQTKYDALIRSLDFRQPSTLDYINNWSSEKTKGRIPQLLKKLDPILLSVLMNAIYFKGIWSKTFDPKLTCKDHFIAADGTVQEISMMHSDTARAYADNGTFKTVKLDYGNGSYSMYVMLPEWSHSISDVLNVMKTTDWMKAPKMADGLDVCLPQFTSESDIRLNDIIEDMGMPAMFNPVKADFSGMVDLSTLSDNLYVTLFRQKAKIEVDENGTKAVAVTVAGMEVTGMSDTSFYANRPFLYAIVENATSTICFIGQYTGVGEDVAAKGIGTRILKPIVEQHHRGLYNLSGSKLNAESGSGIYIKDGTKMIAK